MQSLNYIDTLNGSSITLVLAPHSDVIAGSRISRARRIARLSGEHGSYVAISGHSVRFAATQGLTLATQLEDELPEGDALVFIAMETQVYVAQMMGGLVFTEAVQSREEATRSLAEHPEAALIIDTPERGDFAPSYEGCALSLVDNAHYRFGSLFWTLAARGLPHWRHGIACLGILAVILAGFTANTYRVSLAEEAAQQLATAQAAAREAMLRLRPPVAAAQITAVKALVAGLEGYRANGLSRLVFKGGAIRVGGSSLQASDVQRLHAIASDRGDTLHWQREGWQAQWTLDIPATEPTDFIQSALWLSRVQPLWDRQGLHYAIDDVSTGEGGTTIRLALRLPRGDQASYGVLANSLAGVTGEITGLTQHFENTLPGRADILLTVWGE